MQTMNKTVRLPNGDAFNGTLNSTASNFQSGTYTYRNGDIYAGDFLYGAKHGFGIYTYSSTGEKY